MLIGIDSLMGANSKESNEKISNDGSAGRNFPMEALILNPFLKKVLTRLCICRCFCT